MEILFITSPLPQLHTLAIALPPIVYLLDIAAAAVGSFLQNLLLPYRDASILFFTLGTTVSGKLHLQSLPKFYGKSPAIENILG
ncbi:hypothetical protein HC766_06060 [Candidatus Gracilibacteria bacterium]|nr:hypothetical protein [Candidatus Gracilibacteria bacterium]